MNAVFCECGMKPFTSRTHYMYMSWLFGQSNVKSITLLNKILKQGIFTKYSTAVAIKKYTIYFCRKSHDQIQC